MKKPTEKSLERSSSGLASSEVDIELRLVAEVVTCKERKKTVVRLDTKQTPKL